MPHLHQDSCHTHSLFEMLLSDHPWNTSASEQNKKMQTLQVCPLTSSPCSLAIQFNFFYFGLFLSNMCMYLTVYTSINQSINQSLFHFYLKLQVTVKLTES